MICLRYAANGRPTWAADIWAKIWMRSWLKTCLQKKYHDGIVVYPFKGIHSVWIFILMVIKQGRRVTKFPSWFCLPSLRFRVYLGKKCHWYISHHGPFYVFLLRNSRLFHKHILLGGKKMMKIDIGKIYSYFSPKFHSSHNK